MVMSLPKGKAEKSYNNDDDFSAVELLLPEDWEEEEKKGFVIGEHHSLVLAPVAEYNGRCLVNHYRCGRGENLNQGVKRQRRHS